MRKNILLLLFCLTIISCGNNKYEKRIIGTWYGLKEKEKLKFDSDSLFINDITKVGTWNANEKKIEYKWLDYMTDSIKTSVYDYQLMSNDTLIFNKSETLNDKLTFINAKDFTDFVLKKNNVKINLEKRLEFSVQTQNQYGIKVFAKMKNDSLYIKTEYSESIQNLDYDLEMILNELNPYFTEDYNNFPEHYKQKVSLEKWKKIKIHYLLFADQNVPKDSIKKIVKKLKESELLKVYQVFQTKEQKYSDFCHLNTVKL